MLFFKNVRVVGNEGQKQETPKGREEPSGKDRGALRQGCFPSLSMETWACGSTPSYQCARMILGWRSYVFTICAENSVTGSQQD